jgi:hypothetical protein
MRILIGTTLFTLVVSILSSADGLASRATGLGSLTNLDWFVSGDDSGVNPFSRIDESQNRQRSLKRPSSGFQIATIYP